MRVRDIMTTEPVVIRPDAPISEAVAVLLEKRFNGLPVVDEAGVLLGILCQSDLVVQQQKLGTPSVFSLLGGFIPLPGWEKTEKEFKKMTALTVREAMTPKPVTVTPEATLQDVADLMVRSKYYSLPVVEDGKLVGIVGKEDILRTVVTPEK